MDPHSISQILTEHWQWAFALAASMFALTAWASLLHPDRRDDIALWLMGAQSEDGWARGFTALFDAVFGRDHLSIRCFVRSALATLAAVALMWWLIGGAGWDRMGGDLSLTSVLVVGLCINVLADYVSLLETRWLLARMPRAAWAQVGVLIFDALATAAIILGAIFLYALSPLHQGEMEGVAEILGVFSIFSIYFYSTFLTSVWTWTYIASTWLMRAVARLRVGYWLDVEGKPVRVLFLLLSTVVGAVTFTGSLLLSGPLARAEDGISPLEQALCAGFGGPVCLDVAALTHDQRRARDLFRLSMTQEERRMAQAIPSFCEHSSRRDCEGRLWFLWQEYGVPSQVLLQNGCSSFESHYCNVLGFATEAGIWVEVDRAEAASLYLRACELGNMGGCANLGSLLERGIEAGPDIAAAVLNYRMACDWGDAASCGRLGILHRDGIGLDSDPAEAARFFRDACELAGEPWCDWDIGIEAGGTTD